MQSKMESILKAHVMGEVFSRVVQFENNKSPYDFFMEADVDESKNLFCSRLGTKDGYEAREPYADESIRNLREELESMLRSLHSLFASIMYQTRTIQLCKDEVSEEAFKKLAGHENAQVFREGTADEHLLFRTIGVTL